MSTAHDTQPLAQHDEPRSGFHPVNVAHLVVGVALVGLTLVWVLVVGDVVADDDVRWLLPVPWVTAGAAGLIAIVTNSHRTHQES